MRPKPELYSSDYAKVFKDSQVIAAYPYRPPYAQTALEFLAQLAADYPRRVLDVGCGLGDIGRRLAPLVDNVDAVDISAGMIEAGRGLPGGDAPNLRWIVGRAEDTPLQPPYALVTAGESLHWMQWEIVLPRFAGALLANGVVALLGRDWEGPAAVRERMRPVLMRYAAVRTWQNVDLVAELEDRKLFDVLGSHDFGPELWQPTIAEYLECRHSQRSFARSAMQAEAADAFDSEVRQALNELCADGAIHRSSDRLRLGVETTVVWGRPRA